MAKRIRYYYDEEACTFRPEEITPKTVIISGLKYVGGAALLAAFILTGIFYFYDSPKEAWLKAQNESLIHEINSLGYRVDTLEFSLTALHSTDNDLYRSLLGVEKIDNGEWNGGIGGSYEEDPNKPSVLKEAEKRLDLLQNKVSLQSKSYNQLYDELRDKKDELRHTPAIKPVSGRIVSGFGMRMHPIHKFRRMHWGLDMQASTGTEIYASADGVVKLAGRSVGGYGKQIEIDHGGYGYITKYAHLSKIMVKKGQVVKRGDLIGLSGNTGLSKGPHLHYEIVKNGKKIDPIDYFYGDLTPDEYVKLREEAALDNESMD